MAATATTSDGKTAYRYSIAALPNGKCAPATLDKTVRVALPSLLRIDTVGDDLDVVFPAALSGADEATLDGIVSGHAGTETVLVYRGDASMQIVGAAVAITAIGTWEELGAFDFDFALAMPIARALIRFFGTIETDGTGSQVRLVEDDLDGNLVTISDIVPLPDTMGAPSLFQFDTKTAPRMGPMSYRLEGQLGADAGSAATSASLKHCHAAFIES